MSRLAALALALTISLGTLLTPTHGAAQSALDPGQMTDAQRQIFRAEVRAYLLNNPEVILEAIRVLEDQQAAAKEDQDATLVKVNMGEIMNDGYSWVGGNPDGDITVVEFMDYRCGYCRKAFEDVKELIRTDGEIRFVVKEFPILGEASMISSRFAIAAKQVAGDDAYEAVHDALMAFTGTPDETALKRLADGLGLKSAPILAAMDNASVTEEIATTRALAQRLQINGTPTFVIGNDMLRGYAPLEAMREIVKTARAE